MKVAMTWRTFQPGLNCSPGRKILAQFLFSARANGPTNPSNRYHFFQPGLKKEREHAHRLSFCMSVYFWKFASRSRDEIEPVIATNLQPGLKLTM